MSFEMIVGLQIKDDIQYNNYRAAMTPILKSFKGGFRYDFKISEVLQNEEGRQINRVFAIFFENKASMESFFSDPKYLEAKKDFFESSVGQRTIISEYSREV